MGTPQPDVGLWVWNRGIRRMGSSTVPEFCSSTNGFRGASGTWLFALIQEIEGEMVKWVIKTVAFVD
jgi:hypothetical protein